MNTISIISSNDANIYSPLARFNYCYVKIYICISRAGIYF